MRTRSKPYVRRGAGAWLVALVAGLMWLLGSAAAATAAPPPVDGEPPSSVSLIPVPVGCPVLEPADVVFVGTMTGKDDVDQVVRFRIDQLRAGSAAPWAIDGLIDVRYGEDYRFLVEGDQYLVGAGFDPVYGALSSTVRPPEPTFGGNAVVGVDDSAVECPVFDDPVRTLNVDGTSVDSGVLSLLSDDRRLLAATFAVPAAIAFATVLALVVLKTFGVLAMKGVFELGRRAVTPVPDHRATRVRVHRTVGDAVPAPQDLVGASQGSPELSAPTDGPPTPPPPSPR